MARYSLKLLFLRKYRSSKKYYRQLRPGKDSLPLENQTLNLLGPGGRTVVSEYYASRGGSSNSSSSSNGTVGNGVKQPQYSQDGSSSWQNGGGATYSKKGTRSVDCCELICDCFLRNKLKTFVFILAAGLMSTSFLYLHNQRLLQYKVYREDVFSPKHGIRLKRCTLPELQPFSIEVKPYISYSYGPNCAHEQNNGVSEVPFSVQNGHHLVRNALNEVADCCYRPFHRSGDKDVRSEGQCRAMPGEITRLPEDVEFIEVFCKSSEGDFSDGYSFVPKKPKVEERIEEFETSKDNPESRMSVLILGLDATSRMNFVRAMPKANRYLLNDMSAVVLRGYTKVAENTLPNLVPFLTGRTLEEFKKECVDESYGGDSVHLDNCPFIWKKFAENGYRTGFAEDDVHISIFNMNWGNAFVSPPTDYYFRPFSLKMQESHSARDGYCYGTMLSFERLLENVRLMAETFTQREPYFQFTWSTKLSHDDLNKMRWGDDSLLALLKHLHTDNLLNNTALLVVGDHGSRLDRIRSTNQGKLEDRLPLAYVVLPPWFRKKYARAYRNLKRNGERIITSAFDMHKTMYDLMRLERLEETTLLDPELNSVIKLAPNETVPLSRLRGSSLFHELPENRTCFAAGIPLHWCVCHRKVPQNKDSDLAKDAADFVVTSINTLLSGWSECAELGVQSIDEVLKWDPSEIIRDDCVEVEKTPANLTTTITTTKNLALVETLEDCGATEVIVLQIAFTTSPGGATFETTVIQLEEGSWKLTEDVVRTNSYEGHSGCVEQKMKPYCNCD